MRILTIIRQSIAISSILDFFFSLQTFNVSARSVMSSSLQPHGLLPDRFLQPWDSPGKNTRAGCHFLLQGIFQTQGSNLHLLHSKADSSPLHHLGRPGMSLRRDPGRCKPRAIQSTFTTMMSNHPYQSGEGTQSHLFGFKSQSHHPVAGTFSNTFKLYHT